VKEEKRIDNYYREQKGKQRLYNGKRGKKSSELQASTCGQMTARSAKKDLGDKG